MIIGNKVRLREKRLADAKRDYAWETDPELARLDAATTVVITFQEYLSNYARELRYPPSTSRRFAIETVAGEHIGNCAYYNVDEAKGEAELGIIIGNRDYWDKGYGADVITALVNYIFCETSLHRIYLKTLKFNGRAQKCFQKCGFIPCGYLDRDGHSFLLMEMPRKQFQEKTKTRDKLSPQ